MGTGLRRSIPALILLISVFIQALGLVALAQYDELLTQAPVPRTLIDGVPVVLSMGDAGELFRKLSTCSVGAVAQSAASLADLLEAGAYPGEVNNALDRLAEDIADSVRFGEAPMRACPPSLIYNATYVALNYVLVGNTLIPRWEPNITIRVAGPVNVFDAFITRLEDMNAPLTAIDRAFNALANPDGFPDPGLVSLLVTMMNKGDDPGVAEVASRVDDVRAEPLTALLYSGGSRCMFSYGLLTGLDAYEPSAMLSYVYFSVRFTDPAGWGVRDAAAYDLLTSCLSSSDILSVWASLVAEAGGSPVIRYSPLSAGHARLDWMTANLTSDGPGYPLLPPSTYKYMSGELAHQVEVMTALMNNPEEFGIFTLSTAALASSLAEALAMNLTDLMAVSSLEAGGLPYVARTLSYDIAAYASALARTVKPALSTHPELARALLDIMVTALMNDPFAPVDPYAMITVMERLGIDVPTRVEEAVDEGMFDTAMRALKEETGLSTAYYKALYLALNTAKHSALPVTEEVLESLPEGVSASEAVESPDTAIEESLAVNDTEEMAQALASTVRAAASYPEGGQYLPAVAEAFLDALMSMAQNLSSTGIIPPESVGALSQALEDPWLSSPYLPTPPSEGSGTVPDPGDLAEELSEMAVETGSPELAMLSSLLLNYSTQQYVNPEAASATASLIESLAQSTPYAQDIGLVLNASIGSAPTLPESGWGTGLGEGESTDEIASLINDLLDQGMVDEAREILDSLPEDMAESVMEELGQGAADILAGGGEQGTINPPSIGLPDLGLRPPSLSLGGAPLSAGGLGDLLPFLAFLIAAPLIILMARSVSGIMHSLSLRRSLRELRTIQSAGGRELPKGARMKVIEAYKNLLQVLGRRHRHKASWETHWEYDRSLPEELEGIHRDPAEVFEKAKFSSKPITPEDVQRVIEAIRKASGE